MNTYKLILLILVALMLTSSKSIVMEDNLNAGISMNRLGILCITNKLDCAINYEYKWGKKGEWQTVCLYSNWNRTHYYTYTDGKCVSPTFYIRFDCDLSDFNRFEKYKLERYASSSKNCDTAYSYAFEKKSMHSNYFDLYDCE